jgi:uncharacterized protein YbjT (DUF2867 family)|tara:strand:- start:27205 stop:28086 length:882 start_codon:yes stop_codon:yes gene_type:complete
MITILGATGQIGSKITARLLAKGLSIRVVSRDREFLKSYISKGADPFVSHLDNTDGLTKAFDGSKAVFTLIPPNLTTPNVREFMKRVSNAEVAAIKKAGVQRVVVLSSIGAHITENLSHIAGHNEHELRLAKLQNVDVHILRPEYFMENVLFSQRTIQDQNVWGSPLDSDLPLSMVATQDIAAAAVVALTGNPEPGVRELLGPESISCSQVTEIMADVLNRPSLQYIQYSYEDTRNAIINFRGASPDYANDLIEMYKSYNEGLLVPEFPISQGSTTSTTFREFAETTLKKLKS